MAALVLALVAVGTAIGGFGGPAAAAGLPPSLEVVAESFQPIDPNATPEPLPSDEPLPTAVPASGAPASRDALVRARPDGLTG